MDDARNYSERRDFIRMFVDAMVNFHLPGHSDTVYSGKSRNLSGKGLLFHSPLDLEPEQTVFFRLGSEQSKLPPLEGEARVVRCTPSDESGYEVAAEILRIT